MVRGWMISVKNGVTIPYPPFSSFFQFYIVEGGHCRLQVLVTGASDKIARWYRMNEDSTITHEGAC